MNIKFRQSLNLLPRVFILSALVFLSQVSTAFAEDFNKWSLVQPVNWEHRDPRCVNGGTVRIDRLTANSRGGSALISFFYGQDEWGWGCKQGSSQQFLYSWVFDRDVSSIFANRGDTMFVATLSIESSKQPPPNCPSLNPWMTIRSDSNNFAQNPDGHVYANSSYSYHTPGPRVIRSYNPLWSEGIIQVILGGPGGVGFCLDLVIKYDFKGTIGASGNLSDCIFNWAETLYPDFFAPHIQSSSLLGYIYRYYSDTDIYLATYSDGNLYIYAPDYFDDVIYCGTIADFANLAGCH